MITEDYCSFEVAKLLKAKGFDEPCQAYWRVFENGDRVHTTFAPNENHNKAKGFISMPTHQMAMKWLREKGIYINIIYTGEIYHYFIADIFDSNNEVWYKNSIEESTYEEALEAALKFSLENLI